MLCFSSTTRADRQRKPPPPKQRAAPSRSQVIRTWSLLALWSLLMSFGVVYLLNPVWLQELSRPGKDVEALDGKNFGDAAFREGKYGVAIANYRRSLEILPDQVPVLTNLAIAYRKIGDAASGARILTDALQRQTSPSLRAVIHHNLGELYEEQDQWDQALHYYQEALRCDVGHDRTCRRLAMLYIKMGDYQKARAAFETALMHLLNPDLEYRRMLQEAVDIYQDEPKHLKIIEQHLARGVDDADLKYYDLEIIRDTQAHDLTIASIHDHLGLVCVHLRDFDAAVDHFEKSLAICPDNPNTVERVRQLRQMQGKQP
jgi:tetratricopeptide (TPR) repeat protein